MSWILHENTTLVVCANWHLLTNLEMNIWVWSYHRGNQIHWGSYAVKLAFLFQQLLQVLKVIGRDQCSPRDLVYIYNMHVYTKISYAIVATQSSINYCLNWRRNMIATLKRIHSLIIWPIKESKIWLKIGRITLREISNLQDDLFQWQKKFEN